MDTVLLEPWLERARDTPPALDVEVLPDANSPRDLWIDWSLLRESAHWSWILDFMELLDLLWRSDAAAAWTLLLDVVNQRENLDLVRNEPMRIRLFVHSPLVTDKAGMDHFQNTLFRLGERDLASQYESARAILLDFLPASATLSGIPIQIHFSYLAHEPATIQTFLSRIVEMAQFRTTRDPENPVFQWTSVAFHGLTTPTLDLMYDHLLSLIDLDLVVDRVALPRRIPLHSPELALALWRRALLGNTIRSLSLVLSMEFRAFQGLCTGLMRRQSPTKIVVWRDHHEQVDDERLPRWQWLAAALFRGNPTPICVFLDLSLFSRSDAEAVESVLGASDPIAVLLPSASARQVVEIRHGAILQVGDTPGSSQSVRLEDPTISARVVDETSDSHLGVLYFGLGLCWVHRGDVIRRYTDELVHDQELVIPHLQLRVSDRTFMEGVVSLLQRVGSGVVRLSLNCQYCHPGDERFWETILDACPNLERLDIESAQLSGLSWLSNKRSTKLRVLSLDGVHFADTDPMRAFLNMLADNSHPLTKSLCEFHTQWIVVENCFPQVVEMLAQNRSLERCILSMEAVDEDERERIEAFKSRHVVLPKCERPLRLSSRLAFLSVMREKRECFDLDANVLLQVFAFAAENKRRKCMVVYREF